MSHKSYSPAQPSQPSLMISAGCLASDRLQSSIPPSLPGTKPRPARRNPLINNFRDPRKSGRAGPDQSVLIVYPAYYISMYY